MFRSLCRSLFHLFRGWLSLCWVCFTCVVFVWRLRNLRPLVSYAVVTYVNGGGCVVCMQTYSNTTQRQIQQYMKQNNYIRDESDDIRINKNIERTTKDNETTILHNTIL